MLKGQGVNLDFKHWWVIPLFVRLLVGGFGFEGTGYLVLRIRVHSFKGTGVPYVVSNYPA